MGRERARCNDKHEKRDMRGSILHHIPNTELISIRLLLETRQFVEQRQTHTDRKVFDHRGNRFYWQPTEDTKLKESPWPSWGT